ncbi:MAG: cobalamin-dependent protein, partial [Treponema sp.]|nr:cobalamin-dependent protein [Treponema sp.]
MPDILLVTINAKWIHPSLALRLLKANLGGLEARCEIIEFALRQPLREKVDPVLKARPRILGVSVSIWNHTATLELFAELEQAWDAGEVARPLVVLGGPEVSHLPPGAGLFRFADYVIRGEGEIAFRALCERILEPQGREDSLEPYASHYAKEIDVAAINSAYYLYTDEDLRGKLIYVEASRGCPGNCEFCLSAVKEDSSARSAAVREFPLEPFLAAMDELIRRGLRCAAPRHGLTFKFLDRSFNVNISRAQRIMEFFLERLGEQAAEAGPPFTVHFEMIPSRFPAELRETISRFPPGALRLETGIQTLNSEAAALVGRPADPEGELETLRFLWEKTGAIIHVDLIAGLPGEDLVSFGRGFDRLCGLMIETAALSAGPAGHPRAEIQLGILKLLPGAPIARHTKTFGMRYSPAPPYEVLETAALPAAGMERLKNFARFWELTVNRGLVDISAWQGPSIFERFMALSDALLARFGRNWGIDKNELRKAAELAGRKFPLTNP